MARRSKVDLFGDDAPIWRFLKALPAIQNPEESRIAHSGLFVIEVLPALALPAFNEKFYGYRKGPKYNPANKTQFRKSDWRAVIETIVKIARAIRIEGLEDWALETAKIEAPRKAIKMKSTLFCAPHRLSLANQAPRIFDHDRRSNRWLHGFARQRTDDRAP